jgi:NAD(P)-dependent dehydrogenase (short-subunit alcohol dehydrogenase family)
MPSPQRETRSALTPFHSHAGCRDKADVGRLLTDETMVRDIEAARRQVIERLPIGRMGTPDDIAKGILFLASDDAAFMTGAGLVIDGGITAQ